MTLSDSEIIELVRKGATHQFAHLVDRYKDRGMTLAVRMLKDREDAEEALQDAFIRAYNAMNKFEGRAKFGTWFYRILYNVCLTKLESQKNKFQSIEYGDENSYENIDSITTFSIDTEYEKKELSSLMKTIIDGMPEKYSTILSLFYFQELNHHEICEVTKLPLGTVKTHLSRARAILNKQLSQKLQHEGALL